MLSEPKPGGGIYTSTIPGSVMLDPLYDITASPLSVKLIDDCDAYGVLARRPQYRAHVPAGSGQPGWLL